MTVTTLGLQIPNFSYSGVPDGQLFERVAGVATTAEEAGFDSLWVMDHFYQIGAVGRRSEPMLEGYTLLGALAARTSRASLGTMVTGVTYRNPALLAKMATTLDVISSGRAVLGIGAAWNDDEHEGYGFSFPGAAERLDRLEEALQICRAMFVEEAPSFQGRYFRTHQALNVPRPVRADGIPILVGGGGERRTLRLVAEYADACNVFGDVDTVAHKLDVLRRHCDDVGRDRSEITATRLGTLIVAATDAQAERKVSDWRSTRGLDDERWKALGVVAGSPAAVADQVATFLDAGLDGVVFNLADAEEIEPVQLAGEALREVVAAGGRR